MVKFALRTLWRRKTRTILTALGIVIGIMALTVLGALAIRMNQQVNGVKDWVASTITVVPSGNDLFVRGANNSFFEHKKLEEVKAIQGVEDAAVSLTVSAEETGGHGPAMQNFVVGVDLSHPDERVLSLALVDGRLLEEGDEHKVLLGSTIADTEGVGVGDSIELRSTAFEVVGVLDATLTAPDQMAFVSLADTQEALRTTFPVFEIGDVVDSISVTALPGEDEEALADRIEEQVAGVDAITPAEAEKQISQFSMIFNAIVLGVALLALIVGGLSIINTMVMAVSERTREIGLKKAIGAETHSILGEILLESGMIGFWGGLFGVLVGVALILFFNNMSASSGVTVFALTPLVVIGPIIFATLLGTAAGLFPALRASRLDPVEALKEV